MWTWIPKTYNIDLATSILPGHLIRTITLLGKGKKPSHSLKRQLIHFSSLKVEQIHYSSFYTPKKAY